MNTVRNIRDLLTEHFIDGTVIEDTNRIRVVTNRAVPLNVQEAIRASAPIGTILSFLIDTKDKTPVPQTLLKWMKDTGTYLNDSSKN